MKKSLALVLLLASVNVFGTVVSEANWVGAEAHPNGPISSITTPNVIVGSASNRLLLCGVGFNTGTAHPTASVSTASFNGTGLTLLDTQRISVSGASAVTETWFLKAPANTSAPVLLTFSASVDEAVAICHSLTGVNQSTTFGTVAKASSVAGSSRAECDVAEPCLLVTSQSGALVEEIMWFDSPNPRACYVHGVGPTGIARPAAVSTFCLGFPAAWYDTNGTSTRTQVYQYEEAGASSVSVDWFMAGNDLSGRHWNLMAFGINP